MDKVFQIHLAGMHFTIEEKAYQLLKNYLDKLHAHFQNNSEVVLDIESRMAELFQQKLGSNRNTLFEQDITEVCITLGNINQMDEDGHVHAEPTIAAAYEHPSLKTRKLRRNPFDESLGGVCSGIASFFDVDPVLIRILFVLLLVVYGSGVLMYLVLWAVVPKANLEESEIMRLQRQNRTRRLFRNPDSRVVGGVASGLASYFGLDLVWIRLAFVASIFLFGTGFWLYIVLWIIVPKANSASDKLLMKGEPVDIKNIEKEYLKNQGNNKMNSIANHGTTILSMIVKGVLKLIGGLVAIILFISVVSISVFMVAMFFNLGNTQQINQLIAISVKDQSIIWTAKMGVFFTLLIPFVALLMLVLKALFKIKLANKTWGITLGGLFLVGVVLMAYAGSFFAYSLKQHENRTISYKINKADTLQIVGIEMPFADENNSDNLTELAFFNKGVVLDNDSIYFEIDDVSIKPGKTDSIILKVIFHSNGANTNDAFNHIEAINYYCKIEGNKITLPSYFSLHKDKQFTWQEVDLVLYAPKGTILKFDDVSKEILNDDNIDEADGEFYAVTSKGLKCQDCNDDAEEEAENTVEDINLDGENGNVKINIGGDSGTFKMDINSNDKEEGDAHVKIEIDDKNKNGVKKTKTTTTIKNGKKIKVIETRVGPMVIKKETEIE